MSELGQWLRETRQTKELSLEDVEAGTRIHARFLAALEEETYDRLPGEIYIKGFLRNYALFLDLDPEEVLKKYQKRDTNHQNAEPSFFHPLEVAFPRPTDTWLRGRLLLLVLIASLITAGLWAWKTGRLVWPPPLALFQRTATATRMPTQTPAVSSAASPTRPPQPTSTVTTQQTVTPTSSPTSRSTPATRVLIAPTSTATSSPTPTATLEPTPESTTESSTPIATLTSQPGISVTLSITITEASWVEVTVDSLNVFRGLMEAGEQGNWGGQREIILLLGNAGGVEVTVNGQLLGTLGERQQVIEFAWGPEGVVTPEPTATATSERPTEPPEIPRP